MDWQNMNEIQEQIKLQQQMIALENSAKQFLEKEAILRYGNIKAVNPQKAFQIALFICEIAQKGQLHDKLTDEGFKQLLLQLEEPKKEFHFTRK